MDTKVLKQYADLEQKEKELKEELDHVSKLKQELQAEVQQVFLDEEISKFTVRVYSSSGNPVDRTLHLNRTLWASYQNDNGNKQAAKQKLIESMKDSEFDYLVQENFDTKKLSAAIREFDPDGTKRPEEIIEELPDQIKPYIKITEKIDVKSRKS